MYKKQQVSLSLKDLPQQGRMNRQFEGNEAAIWATCVAKLPPEPLRFVLNASVESLPTNANLHKWGKRPSASCPLCQGYNQSLLHILNDCPTAMALRRYATRHNEVLCHLVTFIQHHLPPSYIMTADLPDSTYSFPQHITPTNLRPDVVWWSGQLKVVWLLELTCSFETTMDQAHHLKEAKYHDLVEEMRNAGYQASCLAFEVGSRGLIVQSELLELRQALGAPAKPTTQLGVALSRCAILGSFKVCCCRNLSGD